MINTMPIVAAAQSEDSTRSLQRKPGEVTCIGLQLHWTWVYEELIDKICSGVKAT